MHTAAATACGYGGGAAMNAIAQITARHEFSHNQTVRRFGVCTAEHDTPPRAQSAVYRNFLLTYLLSRCNRQTRTHFDSPREAVHIAAVHFPERALPQRLTRALVFE